MAADCFEIRAPVTVRPFTVGGTVTLRPFAALAPVAVGLSPELTESPLYPGLWF